MTLNGVSATVARRKLVKVELKGKNGRYRFTIGRFTHKLELSPGGGWMLYRSLRDPATEDEAGIESSEFTSLAEAIHFAIEEADPELELET